MTERCNGSCKTEANSDGITPQLSAGNEETITGYVSDYRVPKMDCPSEEGMIRMALDNIEPKVALEFDTPNRKVRIFHGDNGELIEMKMHALGLGAVLEQINSVENSTIARAHASAEQASQNEAFILKWLLAINAVMFGIEIVVGWLAQSTGLIADSLDMLADAAVYGVSLYAVGHGARMKLHAAHFSGWLQVILVLGVLGEVLRRFVQGSEPVSGLMMGFGFVALLANICCLVLIYKYRDGSAHMKASWIFSANDVIANIGVMLAGFLVAWTGSRYPDLVVGLIIGVIVLNGARRILQLKS